MNAGQPTWQYWGGDFFAYFFFPPILKSCTHSLHTSRFCHHLLAKAVVVRIDQLASSDVWGWSFWRFSNSCWDNAYSHSRGGTKHLQGALNSLLTPAIEEYSGQFPCGLLYHYCLANSGKVALPSNSCRHSIWNFGGRVQHNAVTASLVVLSMWHCVNISQIQVQLFTFFQPCS
jgi:hypothetical protein